MDNKIDFIRIELYKANNSKDLKILQDLLWDYLWYSEDFPDDAFNLLVETLSTKALYDKKVSSFIEDGLFFAFNLSQLKIQQLITIIREQYPNYNHYFLGYTLCEFISDQLE